MKDVYLPYLHVDSINVEAQKLYITAPRSYQMRDRAVFLYLVRKGMHYKEDNLPFGLMSNGRVSKWNVRFFKFSME